MARDDKAEAEVAEALPMLRWLRILVTALAVVMGLGIMVIVALLWLRLSAPVLPDLPEAITLPAGAAPAAAAPVGPDPALAALQSRVGELERQLAALADGA